LTTACFVASAIRDNPSAFGVGLPNRLKSKPGSADARLKNEHFCNAQRLAESAPEKAAFSVAKPVSNP
jgi:hypothetical protein